MGVSFAIPSETLKDVYNQLKNSGRVKEDDWIFIQQVDKELAESFELDRPKGAVARILEDSPASKLMSDKEM